MLPEPVPAGIGIRILSDAEGRIVGLEWEVPEVREIPIRRRDPEETRALLLGGPLPADLAAALADEIGPET